MIVLIHNHQETVEVLDSNLIPITGLVHHKNIAKTFIDLAQNFPDVLLLWCHEDLKGAINAKALSEIFHHKRLLASFNPLNKDFMPEQIGYVEQSYYVKVNKKVTFPTWLCSPLIGGVHSSVIGHLKNHLKANCGFGYFLNALTKKAMANGLFCYSEPRLLTSGIKLDLEPLIASKKELFRFVKEHYKPSWSLFLLLSFFIYEKKLPLYAFLNSITLKNKNHPFDLSVIPMASNRSVIHKREVDVIIPTMGREAYLHDVLKDFSRQTLLPKNIIIVEQNPVSGSQSKLDYLQSKSWPFKIKHHFIHQTGVCNARNLALSEVKSEWTFLGDDDNRFEPNMLETLFEGIAQTGVKVATTVYIQPHETQTYMKTSQTSIFGAGNSMLRSDLLKKVKFDNKYEFNYGEDTDFGMQLRHIGEDVVFLPNVKITHLKAPIGGYRTKIKQLWDEDKVTPKPSPTIMLLKQNYFNAAQLKGYKLLLFLKYYRAQQLKNPFSYYKAFKEQWNKSLFWYNVLRQN